MSLNMLYELCIPAVLAGLPITNISNFNIEALI